MANKNNFNKSQMLVLLAVAVVFIAAAYFIFSSEYSSTGNAVANPIFKDGLTGYAVDDAEYSANSPEYTVAKYIGSPNIKDNTRGPMLIYPYYTSSSTDSAAQDTKITLTNTGDDYLYPHLFFVDMDNCVEADQIITLSPDQTTSFLISDIDPGTNGFLIVIAANNKGEYINAPDLIGAAYVKELFQTPNILQIRYNAIPIQSPLPLGSVIPELKFDDINYNKLPNYVIVQGLLGPLTDHTTKIVLIKPDMTPVQITGLLYATDANGKVSSSSLESMPTVGCGTRQIISSSFPRTTPRIDQILSSGSSSGYLLLSSVNTGMLGLQMTYNSNLKISGGDTLIGACPAPIQGCPPPQCPLSCPTTTLNLNTAGTLGGGNDQAPENNGGTQ